MNKFQSFYANDLKLGKYILVTAALQPYDHSPYGSYVLDLQYSYLLFTEDNSISCTRLGSCI